MSTLLKPILVRNKLIEKKLQFFKPSDLTLLFGESSSVIKYFVEEQTKQGLFVRLKKGLYLLATEIVGEEEIANALYQPSYISLEYALAYYNILPEMPYKITSVTTKPTRNFETKRGVFTYNTIRKEAYTGYKLYAENEKRVLMAEPEKALVDYLYFTAIGKKGINERLMVKNLEKKKILEYAFLYKRAKLLEIIEKIC